MVLPTKKQYDYPTIYQLYQHHKSPKRESRDFSKHTQSIKHKTIGNLHNTRQNS